MAKKSTKNLKSNLTVQVGRRLREGLAVLIGALAIFLLLALVTYHAMDPGWSVDTVAPIQNAGGRVGAWCADVLYSFLGYFAILTPFLIAYGVWILFQEREVIPMPLRVLRWFGVVLTLIAGSSLTSLSLSAFASSLPQGAGGILGGVFSNLLLPTFNYTGSLLMTLGGLLVGLTLFSGLLWLRCVKVLAKAIYFGLMTLFAGIAAAWRKMNTLKPESTARPEPELNIQTRPEADEPPFDSEEPEPLKPLAAKPILKKVQIVAAAAVEPKPLAARPVKAAVKAASGKIPSVTLLDKPEKSVTKISEESLNHMARLLEEKLADFGITAKVVGACPGPVITRYELDLAAGVKVSRLSTLAKDLARALSAHSVRIVEVIPGKPYVGLEIPNEKREIVRLREVLDSDKFSQIKSPLAMGLGKDISGAPEVVDLAKMPHLLVAGTTGSGKSVGLNAMLLSMLLKAGPDELRMILIDPKMLELSIYEGVPHLLTPVVTDMKEAASALRWSVKEMDRRYKLMAAMGVRNIAGFNEKVKAAEAGGKPITDPIWQQLNPGLPDAPVLKTLPYIVVLVDEFADLFMVVGKKIEELIARIAQKARAAGIHLILATQRPSVDVVTGLIKANIPTRIAFQVSSRIDSRTILDQQGAEHLLGHGDMLYLPPGTGVPNRVHGAYVADHEVFAVVNAWKALGTPEYISSITETAEEGEGGEGSDGGGGEKDPLYDEAVQIVMESQRASISGIQRRLKIGYNRAARLLEDMESAGLVSAMQSNGLREILVQRD